MEIHAEERRAVCEGSHLRAVDFIIEMLADLNLLIVPDLNLEALQCLCNRANLLPFR